MAAPFAAEFELRPAQSSRAARRIACRGLARTGVASSPSPWPVKIADCCALDVAIRRFAGRVRATMLRTSARAAHLLRGRTPCRQRTQGRPPLTLLASCKHHSAHNSRSNHGSKTCLVWCRDRHRWHGCARDAHTRANPDAVGHAHACGHRRRARWVRKISRRYGFAVQGITPASSRCRDPENRGRSSSWTLTRCRWTTGRRRCVSSPHGHKASIHRAAVPVNQLARQPAPSSSSTRGQHGTRTPAVPA